MFKLGILNESKAGRSGSRPESLFDRLYRSPALLVLIIATSVFAAESVTMVFLAQIPGLPTRAVVILDSVCLLILLIPAFSFFIFRPLLLQITVRENVEAELITQRNRLRGVLDALVDGIYIVGRQHEIEYINGALEHEFGPVSGRKCYEYTYDRTEPCPWCRKSEVPTGGPARREWDSSRTGKTYELFETPISDSEGAVARLKIFHDVTGRKRALEEVQNSREQLRNLSAHLQAAREEERTAISREIHDELGQVLATLRLDISWLVGGLNDDQKHLAEKAGLMTGLIERTVRTVQRISSELRPPLLDELGLADALEWQAKEFQKRSAIPCEIAVELEGSAIERHVSTALYRIFQEALTNVLRHAGATRVEASLTERGGKVVLMVRDNGRGITREQHGDPLSIGLIGMRERTRMLGGKIKIRGEEWKGTAIIVRIPVPRREE